MESLGHCKMEIAERLCYVAVDARRARVRAA